MGKNEESIREFFDGHAVEYRSKYTRKEQFYEYFFYERLDRATSGISFSDKKILDIGAGTGPLYDYLTDKGFSDFKRYDATDLSGGMLAQSKIPQEHQYVGDFLELKFEQTYDFVFMLGVSTYLTPENMQEHVQKIKKILAPGGTFIVTFTNKRSLDIQLRSILSPIVRLFASRNRIIAQEFNTWFYSMSEAKKILEADFELAEIRGLNHTFFPFSRIFQRASISLAKRISKLGEKKLKYWLSSDLLFSAIKKSGK